MHGPTFIHWASCSMNSWWMRYRSTVKGYGARATTRCGGSFGKRNRSAPATSSAASATRQLRWRCPDVQRYRLSRDSFVAIWIPGGQEKAHPQSADSGDAQATSRSPGASTKSVAAPASLSDVAANAVQAAKSTVVPGAEAVATQVVNDPAKAAIGAAGLALILSGPEGPGLGLGLFTENESLLVGTGLDLITPVLSRNPASRHGERIVPCWSGYDPSDCAAMIMWSGETPTTRP